MLVDLDRKALESLCKGQAPYFSVFDHPLVKKAGSDYCGGQVDSWQGFKSLEALTDEELFDLYNVCRKSFGW